MAAIESDPISKQALAHALTKLRRFAESVRLANSLQPKELKTPFELAAFAKELQNITEKEPGPMTMEEIYRWAIAWAKRELIRAKIARGETSLQFKANPKQIHPAVRSSEEANIFRDENDPCIA